MVARPIPDRHEGAIMTIPDPQKPRNPLKNNETEKRRNHRQKSSFVVRNGLNPLNSLPNQ
jgi:hypothetical protein